MARRITSSQLRSQIRRAEQQHRQAINKYNAEVRKYNSDVRRAVVTYNRNVNAYNAQVRSNRQRFRQELARLNSSARTTQRVVHQHRVMVVRQSFARVERSVEVGLWEAGDDIFDMVEGEAANSVAVLNTLLDEPLAESDEAWTELQATSILEELQDIGPDLVKSWTGALYSLAPANPDAARHFCTSAREMLATILDIEAPQAAVLQADPDAPRTKDGRVTRRARLAYLLERRGTPDPDLEEFVEVDVEDVVALFEEVNGGTHGMVGQYDRSQLAAIKDRVEGVIRFVYHLARA